MKNRLAARSAALAALLISASAALVSGGTTAAASGALAGTFDLAAGSCSHGSISGSYIQMILPSGSTSGPYMSNSDSSCSNQAYTLLTPGSDGGLEFGSYQPLPSPAFDSAGNAQAHSLSEPAQYEGTGFATSTNPVDPQTHSKVPAPSLTAHGKSVTADLQAFSVSWNNQYFNQGAPKPGGSEPGITRTPTGTYDASTGAMTLSWTSEVVGGPFDKFTGSWHLVGRFVPTATASTGGSGNPSHGGGTAVAPSTAASSVASPGVTSSPTASGKAAKPGDATTGAPVAATSGSSPAAALSTSVVTKHTWSVSWWLVVLLLIVAVAGFGGLAALPRSKPDKPTES